MSDLPRRTDYTGLVHVVIYAGAREAWCEALFGISSTLTTILREDQPQWNNPPTCLWCATIVCDL